MKNQTEQNSQKSKEFEIPLINGLFQDDAKKTNNSEDFDNEIKSSGDNKLPEHVERTTLGKMKNNVPLGFFGIADSTSKQTSFDFKDWSFKEERDIAKLKKEMMDKGQGPMFITKLLMYMCENMLGIPINQIQIEQQKLGFAGQIFFSDILYMYFYLRTKALGNELELEVDCPSCQSNFIFRTDLENLTVRKLKNDRTLNDLCQKIELKDGFYLNGSHHKSLFIAPTRWTSIMNSKDSQIQDEAVRKELFIKTSVTGINESFEKGFVWTDDILNQLKKIDFEKLYKKIVENNLGPDMLVSTKCESCQTKLFKIVDWSYENFFLTS